MQQSLTMPLVRYFLGVGGTLLALLFALNAYLASPVVAPVVSVAPVTAEAEQFKPMLRIRSAQKLPERIVIDTSLPTIVPPAAVLVAETSAKASALNALAQMPSSDAKNADAKNAEVKNAEVKAAELKKPEPKAPKRRVAKRTVRQPMVAYALPPRTVYAQAPPRFDFDLFAHN